MRFKTILPLAIMAVAPLTRADELQFKDGSVLKGKILGLEQVTEDGVTKGVFTIQSPSVKDPIKVNQSDVVTFSTDHPFFIATAGQTEAKGTVESTPTGVKVASSDGVVTSTVANIKDGWNPGDPSPAERARAALIRHWEYAADVSIIGKTGNGDSIGANVGLEAVNKGPDDQLKFYARYDYAKAKAINSTTGWSKTSDNLHAGLSYESYFAKPLYWYVRSDNGFDRVRQITFFTTDAVGVGTFLIDNNTKGHRQHLQIFGGLAYRYEDYKPTAGLQNTNSPGLDAGLHHDCEFKYFVMNNDLSYTPAFDNFANYIAIHDSNIEMPLSDDDHWKLRIGMRNEYRSRIAPGNKYLDTTYYLKFVYKWK